MALNNFGLSFNGTSNYAKLSPNASLRNMENFTFMAWVKVGAASVDQTQRAYVERQGTGTGIRFALTPIRGKLRFELAVRDGSVDTNYDYSYTWDDYWHHVAFVGRVSGDNPSYEMFLDGVAVANGGIVRTPEVEDDSTTRPISDTAPLGSIYLGNHSLLTSGETFASSTYWQGKIDEIIIRNEATNQSEIVQHIQDKDYWELGDDTAVASYWRFEEGTGTSTVNTKNGAWTGTLSHSTLWNTDRPFIGNGLVDTSAPTAPSSPVTSNVTPDGFKATWGTSTDNVYVQFYEFQLSQFSNFSSYVSYDLGLGQTKTITGLFPNVNYYWRVRSFDAALNASTYTTTQSLTTTPTGDIIAPLPPTNVSATSVAYSSFILNWTSSTSSDEAGYKIDVSTSNEFTTYLAGYQNKDIGNVTTLTVFGASPVTVYYVRLRSYDVAGNESISSVVYRLQTTALPDITPPLPVIVKEPTSVDARAFTAQWEEGVDDTGVTGYRLDVAYDDMFTTFVQTDTKYFNNLDVGNVLSYRVDGLLAETAYFYRLRAYDAAGNIASNGTSSASLITQPLSVDEGGFLYTAQTPTLDFYVSSATPTTTYNAELRVSSTKESYVVFDLSDIAGTVQNAMLRLHTETTTGSAITIYADDVDSPLSTWNTKPTITGASLSTTPSGDGVWIDLDITSLITNNTTVYTIRLTSTSVSDIVFSGSTTDYGPQLVVESDTATATKVDRMVVEETPVFRKNVLTNPSFEAATLAGWTTTGATATVVTTTAAAHGAKVAQLVNTTGTSELQSASGLAATVQNRWWSFRGSCRQTSGTAGTVQLRFREYNGSGTLLTTSTAVTFSTLVDWSLIYATYKTVNAATTEVRIVLSFVAATGATIQYDQCILEEDATIPAYFDGGTSGGTWSGAANASASTYPASLVDVSSYYIGDSNDNNSVGLAWRNVNDTEWIMLSDVTKTHDRTLKSVISRVAKSVGAYNYVKNPSAEVDITGWSTNNVGTIITRVASTDAPSDYVFRFVPSNSLARGMTQVLPFNQVGTVVLRAEVKAIVGSLVLPQITLYNSSSTVITSNLTTSFFGTGEWQTVYAVLPNTSSAVSYALLNIYIQDSLNQEAFVDQVQFQLAPSLQPYRDGDSLDGIWSGVAHNSISGISVQPNETYSVAHVYTDPEGFFDTTNDTELYVGQSITISNAPDDVITVYPIETDVAPTSLFVRIPYVGDDNENATVEIAYRRSDQTTTYAVVGTFNRRDKYIYCSIPNLVSGTSYTITATINDPDGVFNTIDGVIEHTAVTTITGDGADGPARISFGGFVLQGHDDDSVTVSEHDAFGFSERRVQIEEFARVHGAVELESTWRSRRIKMSGAVYGDTPAHLADRLEAMKQALARPRQRLIVDTLANKGRYYTATCTRFSAPQIGGRNYTHLEWDAEFVCADPFAYDAAESVQPLVTIPNAGEITLSNIGDLEAVPFLTIDTISTTPITVSLINQTTGERMIPRSTIIRGDTLTIDSRKYSVKKNGVEIDYTGTFPTLTAGGNTLHFDLYGTGTPTIRVEMRWRNRYI